MDINTLDSQGRSKRKWTPIEDLKLVEALVEYHHEREGNLKNKFKPGYFKVLEERISTELPNARLRAKPNIELEDFEKIEYFTIVQVRLSFVGQILQVQDT